MAMVKFSRGLKVNYVAAGKHLDHVYFATDTKELLMNGVAYGLGADELAGINNAINAKVSSVEFTEPGTIVFKDGKGTTVKTVTIPEATQTAAGLMSAADKVKLDGITKSTSETDQAIADVAADLAKEVKRSTDKDTEFATAHDTMNAAIEANAKAISALGNIEGGGIVDMIDGAKEELVGDAEQYKTMGQLEDAVLAEVKRAGDKEAELAGDIQEINTEMGDKSSATIVAGTVWGAIEELESEAANEKQARDQEVDALDKKVDDFIATKAAANGLASLDENGLVPASQLPSYVDDVIEVANFDALPATGEAGKIYVTIEDGKTYRWGGSAYAEISASLALGETSSTAYAGDKGKANAQAIADHLADKNNPHGVTAEQIGVAPFVGYTPATLPVSDATQTELNKKAVASEVEAEFKGVADSIDALQKADEGIKGRLDVIEGTGAGSVSKAQADAQAYAEGLLTWGEFNA